MNLKQVNLKQVSQNKLHDDTVFMQNNTEIHIGIEGDKAADKNLKISRDRVLILKAGSEENAKYWLDILKQWVLYSQGLEFSKTPIHGDNVDVDDESDDELETTIEFLPVSDKGNSRQPKAIGAYMLKKSPAKLKSWQKRYVTLKDGKLTYYSNVSFCYICSKFDKFHTHNCVPYL